MAFQKVNVSQTIQNKKAENMEFRDEWDRSRNEYNLIHDITRLRKEQNISQKKLAQITRSTQQEISRFEKREHSPSLKMLCRIIDGLGYELVLQKKM